MSRLIRSDFSTAETTMGGSTGGLTAKSSGGESGIRSFIVEKIVVAFGGSTVAANTSGGCKFVYGESSGVPLSTLVFPTPKNGDASSAASAAPLVVELDELEIHTQWFEFVTNEASQGGVSVFAFGK